MSQRLQRPQLDIAGPRGSFRILSWLTISPALLLAPLLVGLLVLTLLLVGVRPLRSLALPSVVIAPAAVAGALVCIRRPAFAAVTIFALVGAAGSLRAFTPIVPERIVDLLLIGLWLGVLVAHLGGRREKESWLWPPLLAPAVFLLLTGLQIFSGPSATAAFQDLKAGAWHMLAVLLVAFAPWPKGTVDRIARGILAVLLVLGAYWLYRFLVGQAPEEAQLAREALAGQFNLRFQGSLPAAPHLALLASTMAPFALAFALGTRGRWRALALLSFSFALLGVLAAEVRTSTVALTVGVIVTILLFLASSAYAGGRRLGTGLAIGLLVVAIGTGAYSIAVGGSPEAEARFAGVFDPTGQKSFQTRLDRWQIALGEVADDPLGEGLGTSGRAVATETFDPSIPLGIDSSYVKVGVEQGIPMMILFGVSLVSLLVGLAVRSVTSRESQQATLGIAAAGSLAALMVMMFNGFYSQLPQALAAWLVIGLGAAQFTTRTRSLRTEDA